MTHPELRVGSARHTFPFSRGLLVESLVNAGAAAPVSAVTAMNLRSIPDPIVVDGASIAKKRPQTVRSTISFLISAIAFAGFRLFGQVLVQFMMVWQR